MSATIETPKARQGKEPVRLSYTDGNVFVTPADKDRFFISAREAIQACKKAIREQEATSEFEKSVVLPLRDFCLARNESIHACFLPLAEFSGLTVYIVGKTENYDFLLSKDVADLSVSFADRGWTVDTHLIPFTAVEDLCTMFDIEKSLQIFGD